MLTTVLEASDREASSYYPHPFTIFMDPLELNHPPCVDDILSTTPQFAAEALEIIPDVELLEPCFRHFIPKLINNIIIMVGTGSMYINYTKFAASTANNNNSAPTIIFQNPDNETKLLLV